MELLTGLSFYFDPIDFVLHLEFYLLAFLKCGFAISKILQQNTCKQVATDLCPFEIFNARSLLFIICNSTTIFPHADSKAVKTNKNKKKNRRRKDQQKDSSSTTNENGNHDKIEVCICA